MQLEQRDNMYTVVRQELHEAQTKLLKAKAKAEKAKQDAKQ